MSTQRITIAKVAGNAGVAMLARFRRWQQSRTTDDVTSHSPDQWTAAAHRQMDGLVASIRTHPHQPPVVFYCEYIDTWSMGCDFDRWLSPADGQCPISVSSRKADLLCYPLPDNRQLASSLQRAMRLTSIRNRHPQETRWLVSRLLDAAMAWSPLVDRAALIVVRHSLGGLVSDEEVKRCLQATPRWLR